MSFFGKLLGGGAAAPIEAVGNVVKTIFGDKGEKLTHEEVMARIAMAPTMVQNEINKVEAGHRSVFVAGWRPFIGWVAGIGIGMYYIPQYAMATVVWIKLLQANGFTELVPYPGSVDGLMELVLALLGMATLRTAEKMAGRAK
jgi:hypothetical protein